MMDMGSMAACADAFSKNKASLEYTFPDSHSR